MRHGLGPYKIPGLFDDGMVTGIWAWADRHTETGRIRADDSDCFFF